MEKRWIAHRTEMRAGSSLPFHRAIRKYGEDSFQIKILGDFSDDDASEKEKAYILEFHTHVSEYGYNVSWGGDGTGSGEKHPWFGQHHTRKVRKELSETKRGRKNPSFKAKGKNHWNRGLIRSEETKEKIRTKRKKQIIKSGWHHTKETKRKIRRARAKQAHHSAEARKKMSDAARAWHASQGHNVL